MPINAVNRKAMHNLAYKNTRIFRPKLNVLYKKTGRVL